MHLKNSFRLIFLALLITLFSSTTAFAYEIISGQDVYLSHPIEDDLYVFGANVTIDKEVFGDLYVVGGVVNIDATIYEDLVVLGGKVDINSEVKGDAKIGGLKSTLNGIIGDDYFVSSWYSDIGPQAKVHGTVLAGSTLLGVDGEIDEYLRGALGVLNFNGIVHKNIEVTVQDSIVVSSQSTVDGNLKYNALLETKIPDGVVKGDILFNKFTAKSETTDTTIKEIFLGLKLLSYFITLVFLLLFILFTPNLLEKSAKLVSENVFKSFGLGFLVLVIGFVGSLILMMTIIGIPIALLLLNILVLIIIFAKIFASYCVASFIIDSKKKIHLKIKRFFLTALIILFYYLTSFIPYLGVVIKFVMFVIGVGSIIMVKQYIYLTLKKKDLI